MSCGECLRDNEENLIQDDTFSSQLLALLTPKNRQNQSPDESLISWPCFILMLHKQDGIKKNKNTGAETLLTPCFRAQTKTNNRKRYLVA